MRRNCVATRVLESSSPTEEVLEPDCPSHREFQRRWKRVVQACDVRTLPDNMVDHSAGGASVAGESGVPDLTTWKISVTGEGVETLDPQLAQRMWCANPLCRGMALDVATLFERRGCPNSTPGPLGEIARKLGALRNSIRSCASDSAPAGAGSQPAPFAVASVVRQQLTVHGVIDPLSRPELQFVEAYAREVVARKLRGLGAGPAAASSVSALMSTINVKATPVLHENSLWSDTPATLNEPATPWISILDGKFVGVSRHSLYVLLPAAPPLDFPLHIISVGNRFHACDTVAESADDGFRRAHPDPGQGDDRAD